MNEIIKKAIAVMGKDFTEIREGKTWTVKGNAFTGQDGIRYERGSVAPKTNVKVFGWSLASSLFTLEHATGIALFLSSDKGAENLANVLIETQPLVIKLGHETRFSAFADIVTAKGITTEKAKTIIAKYAELAKASRAKTTKTATDYTAIFGL